MDKSGNVYVTGYVTSATITFGTAPFLSNDSSGNDDLFVATYDPSGNAIWAKIAGGTGNDKATSIAMDKDGNVLLAGTYTTAFVYGSSGLGNSGFTDVFVAKYDPS